MGIPYFVVFLSLITDQLLTFEYFERLRLYLVVAGRFISRRSLRGDLLAAISSRGFFILGELEFRQSQIWSFEIRTLHFEGVSYFGLVAKQTFYLKIIN